jgi:hypothetical protein
VVAGVVVPPAAVFGSAAGVSPGGHGGQDAVVGVAGLSCPASATEAAAVVGVAGSVVVVGVGVGTHVGAGGLPGGVGTDAGAGSELGLVDGRLGRVRCSFDGVTGADGVSGAVPATGAVAAGSAAAGAGTVGGGTVRASVADSTAENGWRTLAGSGDRGFAGDENAEPPAPVVYQESKPGATTPMSGICSGPARSGKSRAVVAARAWCGDEALSAPAGSTVVWEIARSDAIVRAVAPAPSTGAARELRWCALCLPMKPPCFPE